MGGSASANIDVVGGTFDYEGNTSGLGNPTNTVTVETGAMLELWNASNALNKVIVLTNGAYLLNSGSGIPSNNIIGPLILTNDPSNPTTPSVCQFVLASNTTLNLQGPVTGPGELDMVASVSGIDGQGTIAGVGTLILNGGNSNSFSGGLVQNAGTLILNGGNSFSSSLTQNAGTLILNGDNSLVTNFLLINGGTNIINGTVGSDTTNESGTLSGNGTNLGALDINSTWTLGGTNTVGTFTVGAPAAPSSLTLEGDANVNFELGQTKTPGGSVSDLIVVNGKLTLNGGQINIIPSGILQLGASYTLITYSGSLTVNGLPALNNALNYNLSLNTSVPGQINLVVTSGGPPVWNGGDGPADTDWTEAPNWNGNSVGGETICILPARPASSTPTTPPSIRSSATSPSWAGPGHSSSTAPTLRWAAGPSSTAHPIRRRLTSALISAPASPSSAAVRPPLR